MVIVHRRKPSLVQLILTVGLAAIPLLGACEDTAPTVSPADMPNGSSHVEYVTTANGTILGLVKTGEVKEYLDEMASIDPNQRPLQDQGASSSDGARMSEGIDTVDKKGCWVNLLYCKDPRTGTFSCSNNGGCSYDQWQDVCASLVCRVCGKCSGFDQ